MCCAVSSEPAAKWVLLGSGETGTRGERATAIRFKGAPSPSNSTSSSYTSPTGSLRADESSDHLSAPTFSSKDLLCATGMVSGSEGSSPESDIDNVSVSSSASSKLFELLWRPFPFFNVTSTQRSLPQEDLERSSTRTPEPAVSAPPTFLQPQEAQSKHKKTKSWSHPTELRVKLPKYVETPSMDALLRVQPHSIGGPDKYFMKEGGQSYHGPPQWDYSRLFDVYVHPSTFPEISNYYHCSKNLGSFLVQVKSANPPKAISQSQGNQNEIQPPQPPQPPQAADTATGDAIMSPLSETRLELSRIFSTIAELSSPAHDAESDRSDSSTKSATSQPLTFAKTLVLRLCFATELVSCEDDRVRPLPHPPSSDPGELSESQLESTEILRVAPGHIVMSHIVQQQLQTGACSLVRVSHVSDEGRLSTSKGQVTVHIRPLDKTASILLEVSERQYTVHVHVILNKLP